MLDSLVNQSNASQGSPILRNPRINLANNHVQYAMVWYVNFLLLRSFV